jgi:hypothetical protein
MPDENAATAVTAMAVGRIARRCAEKVERHPFEHARHRDDGNGERQAEDEQHRVGMDESSSPWNDGRYCRVRSTSRQPPPRRAIQRRIEPTNVATMTSAMP